jgi:hypothetical protein
MRRLHPEKSLLQLVGVWHTMVGVPPVVSAIGRTVRVDCLGITGRWVADGIGIAERYDPGFERDVMSGRIVCRPLSGEPPVSDSYSTWTPDSLSNDTSSAK